MNPVQERSVTKMSVAAKKKKKKKSRHESKMGFKDSNFNNFPITILFLSEFQIITELLLGIL